jgi:hypothetical protein
MSRTFRFKRNLSPGFIHFISNIIKQKIFSSINNLPLPESEQSWLLFLPEDEFHELSLLFSNFLIRKRKAGKKVYYLGSNVPLEMLTIAATQIVPQNLLFFMVHFDLLEESQKYIDELSQNLPHVKIHVSGNDKLISLLKLPSHITWIKSVHDLESLLNN